MSRFSEDCEDERFPSDFAAWSFFEANRDRAIKGVRGQRILRELESVLLEMPDKRLYEGVLAAKTGEVCAIGAYAKAKGVLHEDEMLECLEDGDGDYGEYEKTIEVGRRCGMVGVLAAAVAMENDQELSPRHDTPEHRYWHVLGWVQHQIKRSPDPDSAK